MAAHRRSRAGGRHHGRRDADHLDAPAGGTHRRARLWRDVAGRGVRTATCGARGRLLRRRRRARMLAIAWFELKTKLKRLSTYVYFLVFTALAALWMAAAGGAFASANVVFSSDKV